LLTVWSEGYDEPWLIVTDLAPPQTDAAWYGLRPWIEGGFKDFSCFRRGINIIVATLIAAGPLPLGRFYPHPWPASSTGGP